MIRRPPRPPLFPYPTLSRSGTAEELGVAEGEDAAVSRDEPVAVSGRRRRHPDDRLVEGDVPGRPFERGVAEGEDPAIARSEEHTSELQSPCNLVCRLLLEKK